jgi:hypothetical protein
MKFVHTVAALAALLFISGCGGGGGGGDSGTPTASATGAPAAPAALPVECPKKGTSAATAAGCPVTTLTASVAQGASVSPDGFAITIQADGDLDQASLTEANIALWAGSVDVPGNAIKGAIVPGEKSFVFTPLVKLNFGQSALAFRAKVMDTLGRVVEVSVDFSTTAMVCSSTETWSDDLGTCVAVVGAQTVGIGQLQDASCTSTEWTFEKKCFTDAVRSGTVKVAASSAKVNSHPIVFAVFADAAGASVVLPFDVNDPKKPVPIGGNILDGLAVTKINRVIGNPTGLLGNLTVSVGTGNYQFYYDTTANKFAWVKL